MLTATDATPVRRWGYRWSICALLFFATTINYVDRQVIGVLKPTLEAEMHWTEIDYSNIVLAFQLAYAIGLLVMGRVMDWLGTKRGFSFALIVWSIAAIAHSFARSVLGFASARFALGLGESGNFPASIKTIAEWFPKKERALATGIFNAGSNVGAVVTPLVVPWITLTYGWEWAFVATGTFGFIWLFFWWFSYERPEQHAKVSRDELAYINSDPPEPSTKIPWRTLFPHRQTWAFAIAKFLTDPVWWLYLFWVPDFLHKSHGITLTDIGLPLVTIYVIADIGSVAGGWLSSSLIKRGWTVNKGRKTAMLVCAIAVVPIVFASQVESLWLAVVLVGLAASAHQGWSANIFTTASDMFPRRAVGSVVGIGGMAGAIGGMIIAEIVGYVLEATGSYLPIFIMAGCMYLVALLFFHLLVPDMSPARLDEAAT
jgi:MFS transporter, ACS family, aldohexuronate transporter